MVVCAVWQLCNIASIATAWVILKGKECKFFFVTPWRNKAAIDSSPVLVCAPSLFVSRMDYSKWDKMDKEIETQEKKEEEEIKLDTAQRQLPKPGTTGLPGIDM